MSIDPKTTILVVEDSPPLVVAYQEYLRDEPCQVSYVDNGKAALSFIQKTIPNAILLDLGLPDMNGMEILKHVNQHQLNTAVVVITGHGSVDVAVEAMRNQAFDFIEKPFDARRLIVTLRNALQHQRLKKIVATYQENFGRDRYYNFIGASLPMQAVYRIIDSAASSKATVFITGESGTGKELGAEAIHKKSQRQDKPFVAINCAAIPNNLIESEIFGHVKGAFTGAVNERQGAASLANEGTLFFDEIGDMDLDLQSKLLRFVQTGTFRKVGGTKLEKVDVRIVCATNRNPLIDIQEGRFREDLYYRLHVIPIAMPALREREGDVLLIAREFLKKFAREENKNFKEFSPETEAILLRYDWPGNVRQLQNVIHNIVVLNEGSQVVPEMLPEPLNSLSKNPSMMTPPQKATSQSQATPQTRLTIPSDAPIRPLWLVEKETIEHAIELCEGNIPKAAALLEISPSTIYRKRQHWESYKKNG